MKKHLKHLILTGFCLLPGVLLASDFNKALSRHAQAQAREIVVDWVDKRSNGHSWNSILRDQVPETLDDFCGYRNLVRLPENSFKAARNEIIPLAGKRIVEAFGKVLARPGAKLDLVGTRTTGLDHKEQALVTLRVLPAKPGDPRLSLLMELTNNGDMVLCDLVVNENIEHGILRKIGNELDL